jgi:hypothetical protein
MRGTRARLAGVAAICLALLAACEYDGSEAASEHCGQGASCMTTTPSTTPAATPQRLTSQAVAVHGLQFTLPLELVYRSDGGAASGESIDGFYGNFALSSSCANGCASSFGQLPADSVVVALGVATGSNTPAGDAPNTSVAGRPASYEVAHPGICGGDETITVQIPGADVDYVVRACLSGPDLSIGERVVQALVASASFPAS